MTCPAEGKKKLKPRVWSARLLKVNIDFI
jgi:hypothetical protein